MRYAIKIILRHKLLLVVSLLVLTLATIAVFAVEEERVIYVFPTEVTHEGWSEEHNALRQILGSRAIFEDFTSQNSARLTFAEGYSALVPSEVRDRRFESLQQGAWGEDDVPAPAPEELPMQDVSMSEYLRTAARDAVAQAVRAEEEQSQVPIPSGEATPEPVVDATPAVVEEPTGDGEVSKESDGDVDIVTDSKTVTEEGPSDAVGVGTVPEATKDEEALEAEMVSSEDAVNPADDTDSANDTPIEDTEIRGASQTSGGSSSGTGTQTRSSDDDVRSCSVLGLACHTIQFAGFDIGSVLSEHTIKGYTLNLSLGARTYGEPFAPDVIMVRYFHRGSWKLAGQVTIDAEVSNADNGGHFSFALPDLRSWDALRDFRVELEVVRHSDLRTEVYLDSAWVDAVYAVDSSSKPTPEAQNILTELALLEESNRPDILRVDGARIELNHIDDGPGTGLVVRSDREIYHGLANTRAHVGVTNTTDKEQVFRLVARTGETVRVEQIHEYVDRVAFSNTVPDYMDVGYFCETTWEPMIDGVGFGGSLESVVVETDDVAVKEETSDQVFAETASEEDVKEDDIFADSLSEEESIDEKLDSVTDVTEETPEALPLSNEVSLDDTQYVDAYVCRSTSEVQVCETFNADRTNCIVGNERVGVTEETVFGGEWRELNVVDSSARVPSGIFTRLFGRTEETLPIASMLAQAQETATELRIQPGQTRYFAVDLAFEVQRAGAFEISAVSNKMRGSRTMWWQSAYRYRMPVTVDVPEVDFVSIPVLHEVVFNRENEDFFVHADAFGEDVRFYDPLLEREIPVREFDFSYVEQEARYAIELDTTRAGGEATVYVYFGNTDVRSENRLLAPSPTSEPMPYFSLASPRQGMLFSARSLHSGSTIETEDDERRVLSKGVGRDLLIPQSETFVSSQGPVVLTRSTQEQSRATRRPLFTLAPDTYLTEQIARDGRTEYLIERYALQRPLVSFGQAEDLPLPTVGILGQMDRPDILEQLRFARDLRAPRIHDVREEIRDFRFGEALEFKLAYRSQQGAVGRFMQGIFGDTEVQVKGIRLLRNGASIAIGDFDVTYDGPGEWTMRLEETPREIQPGIYTVEVDVMEGEKTYTDSFEFYWGVLAVNTDKSVYTLDEDDTVYLTLGVLSDNGHTICDADLALVVRDPTGHISEISVQPSGYCDGNNVTTVPDYEAYFTPEHVGTHDVKVVHHDKKGNILRVVNDSFRVASSTQFSIRRTGPTRIYPLADYDMTFEVVSEEGFSGQLVEVLPYHFDVVVSDGGTVRKGDGVTTVTWDIAIEPGESRTITYRFDAPDISPYLFLLGPAVLSEDGAALFTEERQWQIASDAVGRMLILWDGGAAPTGWTCVSCGSGDFFQRFIRGAASYGATGGNANHGHSASTAVGPTSATSAQTPAGTNVSNVSHTHAVSLTINTASNLPEYRQLRVLRHNNADTPSSLPAGAILFFTDTVPSGWTRYSAQDGYYIRGENTVGTTGGSNTHTHTLTGSLGAASGSVNGQQSGQTQLGVAVASHTHTFSGTTDSVNHEPPYILTILGRLDSAGTLPIGAIAMWDEDLPNGWTHRSTSGQPFHERFIKPASSYGTTGGNTSHTHADQNITSSGPSGGPLTGRASGQSASAVHTHNVSISDYSNNDHLPPYIDVVFGEFIGLDATFTQDAFRWYQNIDAQTASTTWQTGLLENDPITVDGTRVKSGDVLRLRMSVLVENASTTAGDHAFTLQYGVASSSCSAITTWNDVGAISSSEVWRGFNNSSVADGSTLTTLLLASSTVAGTYEEENDSAVTPNGALENDRIEYDWVVQQNGALGGTTYCFRMIFDDSESLYGYTRYPSVYTDETPSTPTHFYPFDNEKAASTTPWFEFVSDDGEGQDIHYQIQIATDPTFSSTVLDNNSLSQDEQFRNLVVTGDKPPFNSGQRIRYIPPSSLSNGTTYWWRVRARDVSGSLLWGDWSESTSVTIDTTVIIDTWFQTTNEQFTRGTLVDVQASGGSVSLSTTPGTGTLYSPAIDFYDARIGTIWGDLSWNHTVPANSAISYQVEYLTPTQTWELVPNSDLTNNSSGFTSSPVALGGLDSDVYATIRVRANLTSTGGVPSLQDWTVRWGTRVDTPTLYVPFDNEKIATTTPRFEFKTDDPQGDPLTYQIQWSTDPTFTASTTRTSDTDSGFTNVTTPADTDPFNSGDRIRYVLPGADALTNGTTYYWRVRATDADAYSLWSAPYSLTVDTTVEVSTWHQTATAQFATNVLSGTTALNGGVTVATTTGNALIAYGEGTEIAPRYRLWNGASWSAEAEAQTVSAPINWIVTRAGTTRDEYVMGALTTNSRVTVQVYRNGIWGDREVLTTGISNVNKRGFDIAYESISGRAMVVTCDGDSNPSYFTWNGTAWSTAGTITTATGSNCEWIRLASDPTSNAIIMVTLPVGGGQYEAQVWNGTTWGNAVTWGSMSEAHEGIGVSYRSTGGLAVVTVNNDGSSPPNRMVSRTWNGTTWSGITSTNVGYFENGMLRPDPNSVAMELCFIDDASNIETIPWNGTAWGTQVQLDAAAYTKNGRPVDCAWATTTGNIVAAYSDTGAARYRTWNGSTWAAEQNITGIGTSATVQLTRTGDGTILGMFFDVTNGYLFSRWTGGGWTTAQTIEATPSVTSAPYKEPFMIAPQNPLTDGQVFSSPIIFTNGAGQKWDLISWSDSQPGDSEIVYQVQYLSTSSNWALIPNTDLPGNSVGTTTGPIDISSLNTLTYGTLRLVATLSCDGPDTCPTIQEWTVEWSAGATISGTIQEVNQTTNVTSGTVAVAVNNVLQVGRTGTIANGIWSINNVPMLEDDIVTIFVDGTTSDADRASGIFRYSGIGDVSGITLYENHLVLGSDDVQTLTNADIALYDNSVSSYNDIFFDVNTGVLTVCVVGTCDAIRLLIREDTTYRPSSTNAGNVTTHDIEILGTLVADGNTITVSGSWVNSGVFTENTSTVIFSATSSTESIDSTGATNASFYNVTFGSAASTATWELGSLLTVLNNMTVAQGTLSPGAQSVSLTGNLTIQSSGTFAKGTATTTFVGGATAVITDSTTVKQDLGTVEVTGPSKTVRLGTGVKLTNLAVAATNIFDVTANNYPLEVVGDIVNNGSFSARQGTVTLTATTTGRTLTPGSSSFFNLTVNGSGGNWAFGQSAVTIGNNLTIATGTLTLATGTTTVAGNFTNTGGIFVHNNGTLLLTGPGSKTILQNGYPFFNLSVNGTGNWSWTDTNATSSGTILVNLGALTFPTGTYAIGRSLENIGGTLQPNGGTLRFYSATTSTVRTNGSSLHRVRFDGVGGTWTVTDTNLTLLGSIEFNNGTTTLPSGTLGVGGSFLTTNGTWSANGGSVLFNASSTGHTVTVGTSVFNAVTFNNTLGGWTIDGSATSTGAWSITNADTFTVQPGSVIEVGGTFANNAPSATTWAGTTLYLNSGTGYTVGTKTLAEETYGTLRTGAGTHVRLWNASATSYDTQINSSIYSQNHAGILGDLYIYGTYVRSSGADHWSYATDFDGANISATPRQANVRFANTASAEYASTTLNIVGTSIGTTTVANQGSGSYGLIVDNGTLNASYYDITNTNSFGLTLRGSTTVSSLSDGSFVLAANGGTMMTVYAETIDHNPALQPERVGFSTSTGITSGSNVTATGTATSYWWFRDHYGNYDGEAYDNDPGGDPGYIRWDDSGYTIEVSGTAFSGEGTGVASSCNGSTPNVRLVVDGTTSYSTPCDGSTGAFSFPTVSFSGDATMIAYLDTNGGARGATVTRTPQSDITNFDIYQNRVIVRHEDVLPLTITQMFVYDSSDDADIPFTASSSLTIASDTSLHIWPGKTFAPGGNVTILGGGSGSSYDGTLRITSGSSFIASGAQSHSVGGSWVSDVGGTYTPANSTVTFTASNSRTIAPASSFYDAIFSGSGTWTIASSTTIINNLTLSAGTINGTQNITVQNGSFSGNGTVNMTGGTVTVAKGGPFGGNGSWSFNNLTLGDGTTNTTVKTGSGTVTTTGVLTVQNGHTLEAGNGTWVLTGTGSVLSVAGVFSAQTSTTTFAGTSAMTVPALTYHNLVLAPAGAGSPTYTLASGAPSARTLTIGNGTHAVTIDANTNDPLLSINTDVLIRAQGTYLASNSNDLLIGGSYLNEGIFTANGGGVIFNAISTGNTVNTGVSSFHHATFNGAGGGWTMLSNATTTGNFSITNATSFTQASGTTLVVQGIFTNGVGGGATTWTGSTLYLNSGTGYSANTKTAGGDVYDTLRIGPNTHIRAWNSSATTYDVHSSGSFYSQDHGGSDGDLYLWGNYTRSTGADHWSYATDFDGTDISATPRPVSIRLADNATTTLSGGSLTILGAPTASTTIAAQGTGTYSLRVTGGTFSAQHYRIRDIDASGLTFSGSPTVSDLSDGDLLLESNGATMMTIEGSVITANPAKTWYRILFATSTGISSGFNVTAVGTTGSSWRFLPPLGNFYGEDYDSDPGPNGGNPGYLVWDDSEKDVSISGNVYSDEGTTVSSVCNGSTPVVRLVVHGNTATATTVPCALSTGFFEVTDIGYSPADTVTVYLDGTATRAANVTANLITTITDMHLYENRVIVRHEDVDPLTIAAMSVFDSSSDNDIPFTTSTSSTPHTLSLPASTKLIVWNDKTFRPDGAVTLDSGTGSSWDGTLELRTNASFVASSTVSHGITIGGEWLMDESASFTAGLSTVTFTSTSTNKRIQPRTSVFRSLIFNGTGGSWTFETAHATTTGDVTITNGSVALATSTFAVGGSFVNNDVLSAASTTLTFTSVSPASVTFGGYPVGSLRFTGTGTFTMGDTNATSTGSVLISAGNVLLPTGTLAVAHAFEKTGGTFTHSGTLRLYGSLAAQPIRFGGSTIRDLIVDGSGSWSFVDTAATTTGSVAVNAGGLTGPAQHFGVGGSFTNGGIYNANAGLLYLFATTTGNTVNTGGAILADVIFEGVGGGWTVASSATSTGAWRLRQGASFTMASSTTLEVNGVFQNLFGGAATDWTNSTLFLNASGTNYTINTKTTGGDQYANLVVGQNMHLRMWNSAGSTTTVSASSSLYSMNNGAVAGSLNIYGEYSLTSGVEHWSHATDFDGTALGGGSRQANVRIQPGSIITVNGGTLNAIGTSATSTTIEAIGSGAYTWNINAGTINAQHYRVRDLTSNGLSISGSTNVVSLSNGDFELSVQNGVLLTVAASVIDQNPTKLITGVRFATSTGVTAGNNVRRTGATTNFWSFKDHFGGFDGEAYDDDGLDACGAIRWDNSDCLEISQSGYRFRANDGGGGAPNDEWYDNDWDKRKRINIMNPNSTSVANAAVKFDLPYDSAMQTNFSDLVFTDASGTTSIPFTIEDYISSATATVWVKVPSLPANGVSHVYVYYDNPFTSGNEDGIGTFTFFDDFESNSLNAYSGDTIYFTTGSSFAKQGSYGLGASALYRDQETSTGIYRTATSTPRGSTLRWFQYVDTTEDNEPCTLFAVQTPVSTSENYAVCLDQFPDDKVVIAKDVRSRDASGTILASTTVTFSQAWYEVEVDWLTSGTINVSVFDASGALFATTTASDSEYTTGGIGFSFWYQYGGWDFISSRPYVAVMPTVKVGLPQSRDGASWLEAQNAPVSQEQGSVFRVRFAIENSGSSLTGERFRLEYADRTGYGTCNAVPSGSFASVPNVSGCGTSPVCMSNTNQYVDGAPTQQLLSTISNPSFTEGKLIKDPSNQTAAMDLPQGHMTEIEYAVELTPFATSDSYCMRVSAEGDPLDSYQHIAEVTAKYEPVISNWSLNNDAPIALIEGSTVTIRATGTVTDLNGFEDILYATTTVYRSGVGVSCIDDPNNCYQLNSLQCPLTGCSGTTCTIDCSFEMQYFAEPTDMGAYATEHWEAVVYVVDNTFNAATSTSMGIDVWTLRSLSLIGGGINYGEVGLGEDTGSYNATSTLWNTGNIGINVELEGTDLVAGVSSIPVGNQLFATSSFTYAGCVICTALAGTASAVDLNLPKPTSTTPITDTLFWGIHVPTGVAGATHQGLTVFYPVSP
jgi:hypothetical protein